MEKRNSAAAGTAARQAAIASMAGPSRMVLSCLATAVPVRFGGGCASHEVNGEMLNER